jgi:hypothetical protein
MISNYNIITAILNITSNYSFKQNFPASSGIYKLPTPPSFFLTVHPVPAPPSINDDPNNNVRAGGKSQKLMLFNLGNQINSIFFNIDRTIFSSLLKTPIFYVCS